MKISVIASTYNKPEWLQKVIWGYEAQDTKEFELIIADDGSGPETKKLIDTFIQKDIIDIQHIWHDAPDYQRQTILNTAIQKAKYDYILFTDGDCIPRADFVSVHATEAEEGRFLSGGYCKMPDKTSHLIMEEDIKAQNCFDLEWLKNIEPVGRSQKWKLGSKGFVETLLNKVTTAKPSFNNCNSSAFKKDLIAVNGYDERMKYGGPDREIGERLENYGVKGKQIRYSAICLHLDHERGYENKESWALNNSIRQKVAKENLTWTPYGIKKSE